MSKSNVKLSDGVADNLMQSLNNELSEIGKTLIELISEFVKERIRDIDLRELFSKKDEDKLLNIWYSQLVEKGLIPKVYEGLPEDMLIHNLHQEGYLQGMYVGFALALMSLVDNNAEENLILSVMDDIRLNLVCHQYEDSSEFLDRFKSEKYNIVRHDLIGQIGLERNQYWGFFELTDEEFNLIAKKGEVDKILVQTN